MPGSLHHAYRLNAQWHIQAQKNNQNIDEKKNKTMSLKVLMDQNYPAMWFLLRLTYMAACACSNIVILSADTQTLSKPEA